MGVVRDPSDGSVKERPKPDTSGLREIERQKAGEIARLEKSREWLKDWKEIQSVKSNLRPT